MAYDLVFGKTSRNFSCGAQVAKSLYDLEPSGSPDGEYKYTSPVDLGKKVKDEIQKNFDTAFRLTNAKRLPEVERKNFGLFMKKWLEFASPKTPKFKEEDLVMLMNFRKANERFTERFAIFDKMASTPLKVPVEIKPESKAMVQFVPPGTMLEKPKFPWILTSIFGLGVGILGFVFGKRK